MPDYAPDQFTLWSNFNKSKIEGKENEFWAKSDWPVDQIVALYKWAVDPSTAKTTNDRGDECVVVSQKLMPRYSKADGTPFLLGVTKDGKPPEATSAKPSLSSLIDF